MNKVEFLIMDVDGTLTDGKIYMGFDGELCKAFSAKDGYGIHDILIPNGIIPVVITGRKSKILERRCHELGICEIHQGVRHKDKTLYEILERYYAGNNINESLAKVAYIGDDLNDLPVMQLVQRYNGLIGCPADSAGEIKEHADFVSARKGGDGAVREFIEWVIKNSN